MENSHNAECPVCHHQYSIDPKKFGHAFQCKNCKNEVHLIKIDSSGANNIDTDNQWLDEQDHFLLKRILKYEMATQEEIQRGLSLYYQQKKAKKTIRLGGVLVQNGIITQNELELFDTFQDMNKVNEMDRSFAALALKNKLVSLDQIKQAFQKQSEHFKKTKDIIVIGDILHKMGVMTTAYRDAILSRQQRLDVKYMDSSFGAVAIKMGLATRDQIDDALAIQQKLFSMTNKLQLLGNILVDNNVLTDAQTRQILSHQKELKLQAKERENSQNKSQKRSRNKQKKDKKESIVDIQKLIKVIVSKDKLEARILPVKNLPPDTNLDDILFVLSEKNIKYGVVSHFDIRTYLKNPSSHQTPWLIARGKPPVQPEHASIHYKFDLFDRFSCRSHGSIDHLSWDKWPKAKKGNILAERNPGKPGMPGISVHAEIIDVPAPKSVQLINGFGTKLSEDGNQLSATHEGLIASYMRNKICVLPKKVVDGDFSQEKDAFRYKGVLHVKGTIKGQVRSVMVFAEGADNADIQVESDVIISGDLTQSSIQAKGNVVARNISHSQVEAFGHVVSEQYIDSSRVDASGQVSVLTGTIEKSEISAFQGIYAKTIESYKEKCCTLTVGIDTLVKSRIDKLQAQLPSLKQNLEKLSQQMEDLKKVNLQINENIKKLSNFINACNAKKEELTDTHANEKGDQIDSKINDAQKAIEDKKQRIQKNKDRYQQYHKYYRQHLKHVKNTSEELITLTEWLKNGHEPPGIVISETIEKDTKIVSKRCEMILDKEHSHVYIKEIQSNDEGAKFQIESLSDAPN